MSYLALAKKIQAEMKIGAAKPEPPAIEQIIDDRTVAVLIDSTVLGAKIWFALRDDWKPDQDDMTPVFYASELPFLRTKTPEQLRYIFYVKRASRGGWVRQ